MSKRKNSRPRGPCTRWNLATSGTDAQRLAPSGGRGGTHRSRDLLRPSSLTEGGVPSPIWAPSWRARVSCKPPSATTRRRCGSSPTTTMHAAIWMSCWPCSGRVHLRARRRANPTRSDQNAPLPRRLRQAQGDRQSPDDRQSFDPGLDMPPNHELARMEGHPCFRTSRVGLRKPSA
jgi:hypothetical protein